jgi:cholesterol transport system auxiliary component
MRFVWMMVLPLAACVSGPERSADPARFDLGPRPAKAATLDAGIRNVEVLAPPWLAGGRMQYRLLYANPSRRLSYADSAWAAPPADLLAQALMLRLAPAGAGDCKLQVDLDEFAQVFDSATASRFVLEARASLYAEGKLLAGQGFALAQPAATADAKGGVAAAAVAERTLEDKLAGWLRPYLSRCRSG